LESVNELLEKRAYLRAHSTESELAALDARIAVAREAEAQAAAAERAAQVVECRRVVEEMLPQVEAETRALAKGIAALADAEARLAALDAGYRSTVGPHLRRAVLLQLEAWEAAKAPKPTPEDLRVAALRARLEHAERCLASWGDCPERRDAADELRADIAHLRAELSLPGGDATARVRGAPRVRLLGR